MPGMRTRLRVQDLGGSVGWVALVRADRNHYKTPPARAHVGIGGRLAEVRAGEAWETLSYMVIWLCGLAAIGLCFR
jgi:hypothetical protein